MEIAISELLIIISTGEQIQYGVCWQTVYQMFLLLYLSKANNLYHLPSICAVSDVSQALLKIKLFKLVSDINKTK